jgi:Putative transposase/Transposase zinc-binding domain
MSRSLEVADIFRTSGPEWREKYRGHISLGQRKVMSAIERCRTAALGGHVLRCEKCAHLQVSYNSCRNRHCTKCQASAAKNWLNARQHELLPVEYYHVIFTLPATIAAMAYQNKTVIYNLLFRVAAETLRIIAGDPKHLGAQIGVTMVLHSWGSTLVFHPHVHCIVPGGGFSADGQQWIACKPGFFLPVRVLSKLFRRLFLKKLTTAHNKGDLHFFGDQSALADHPTFIEKLKPLRQQNWYVYAKRPFSGPEAVLAYLSRYTHRVAIANSRLISFEENEVKFKYKDYREKGRTRVKSMTLAADEFIRRFLLHVLPRGFHRIRHYGFFANSRRSENLIKAKSLLINEPQNAELTESNTVDQIRVDATYYCPLCSAPMTIIETFLLGQLPRGPPTKGYLSLASPMRGTK